MLILKIWGICISLIEFYFGVFDKYGLIGAYMQNMSDFGSFEKVEFCLKNGHVKNFAPYPYRGICL